MTRTAGTVVAAAATLALLGCAPRETAEQRVTRIRSAHRIQPNGFQPRVGPEGTSELLVSVLVVNQGRESIGHLTLRVHVQDAEGHDRGSALVVLDTSSLVPGVSAQLTGVAGGLEIAAGERVLVELEDEPLPAERPSYPEYAGTPGAAP